MTKKAEEMARMIYQQNVGFVDTPQKMQRAIAAALKAERERVKEECARIAEIMINTAGHIDDSHDLEEFVKEIAAEIRNSEGV